MLTLYMSTCNSRRGIAPLSLSPRYYMHVSSYIVFTNLSHQRMVVISERNSDTEMQGKSSVKSMNQQRLSGCNNINSQLDAKIIILLTISITSTCFGR